MPVGPVQLVPRGDIEVAVERLHIDSKVIGGLGAVDEDRRPVRVRQFHDSTDRVDRPQRIREMNDRHQLGPRPDQPFQLVPRQLTVVGDRRYPEDGPGLLAEHLPRDDVRMMFHAGDDDLVTRSHLRAAERLGHQVDAFRGVAGEDHLTRLARVEKPLNRPSHGLVSLGGRLGEIVHAPVDVGVRLRVVPGQGIEHGPGFLSGRRVVEIDERLSAHIPLQDREVQPDALGVETCLLAGRCRHCLCHAGRLPSSAAGSRSSSARSSFVLIGSRVIRCSTSVANA